MISRATCRGRTREKNFGYRLKCGFGDQKMKKENAATPCMSAYNVNNPKAITLSGFQST